MCYTVMTNLIIYQYFNHPFVIMLNHHQIQKFKLMDYDQFNKQFPMPSTQPELTAGQISQFMIFGPFLN